MSIARLLSPKANLIDEVIHVLISKNRQNVEANDLLLDVIVFPGKRPAHVLRKKLSDKIGTSFIPPMIFSIDLFIDFLFTNQLQIQKNSLDECDAVAILFELHKKLQNEVKINDVHFKTLETFYSIGVQYFTELEELKIAGIEPEQLQSAVSGVTLESAHTLALLYKPFYEELGKKQFTSRAMKYSTVARRVKEIDFKKYNSIVLSGFYAFTQTEFRIVQHLLSLEQTTALFQSGHGIVSTLKQLHLDLTVKEEETVPENYFYESPDAHGQLFTLNRVLKHTFAEEITESEKAVIVLPSAENLFPLYHQTLSQYQAGSYNIALGYPISRTPVYGFLISLLEVAATSKEGRVFVPKYIQFLLHPYTKNILFKSRADVTRTLVHAIEEDRTEHQSRVFIHLEDIEQNSKLFDTVLNQLHKEEIKISDEELRSHLMNIHNVTLRRFLKISTIGDFASMCIDVFLFINDHSTAYRHPYFRPFVEILLEQFSSLKNSLLSPYSLGKLQNYLVFLNHFIESADVPFTGTPLQGLQVLGFLETRGLQFENVFVIDVNDDVLPGRVQQDILLPLVLREQLGLSTYRDQENIKAYIFDVLRKGSKAIHYFYINNNEKEPSRFVAQLQWKEQLKNKSLTQFNTQAQEYKIDLGTHFLTPINKSSEMVSTLKSMSYSSTALDTYLTCGLQFYYGYVLRLQERNEISGDVERSDIGSIVHKILQEYFTSFIEKELKFENLEIDRLRRIINDNFISVYGADQFGEQFFTKRQIEKHLIEFLEGYQKPLIESSSITIEGLEQKFSAEIEGIKFTGNSDRIEKRNDQTYILDFKTGQNEKEYLISFDKLDVGKRETWKEAIGTVQLAMYVMMYSTQWKIAPEKITPAFVFLGKKELNQDIEISLFENEDQAKEWNPKLKKIILTLVNEITNEQIQFNPTDDIKDDCPTCPYQFMCGTQWAEKFSVY